jgi:cytochrome P450
MSTAVIPVFRGSFAFGHLTEFRTRRIELLLRVARSHPEIARVPLGLFNLLVVSSPALIQEVLVEKADCFRKSKGLAVFAEPLLGDGLLRLEHDAHRKRRRMLAPAFMPRRIAGYAREMIARAERSAQRMQRAGRVDIADETMRLTLDIVGKTLFDAEVGGDADEVCAALTQAMTCMVDSFTSRLPLPPKVPTPTNLRLRRAVRRLDRIVYRMIDERRSSRAERGDLLSILLAARDQDDGSALSDREVRDEAMTLFLAGHETTANALAWTLYLLAKNPALRSQLESEVDREVGRAGLAGLDAARLPFALQVVKESMRLLPPVYMFGRQAERELTLGNYPVARGQFVLMNVFGLHRRADIYPDPERFAPERFEVEREKELPRQAFIPFGGGPRICIGNHFALMELQLVLATWISKLRFELYDQGPPRFEPLLTLRPLGGIEMRVSGREGRGVEGRAVVAAG